MYTLINVGEALADLCEWFQVAATDYPDVEALHSMQPIPVQALAVALPTGVLLVDAPAHMEDVAVVTPIPNYTQPPSLTEQLAQAGIAPAEVRHLVITHAHFDHFNDLTVTQEDGSLGVRFPNATHYLGKGDWEEAQDKLADPNSLESQTLGVVHAAGKLTLIDETTEIAPGVTVVPAPGETPGHQVVRIETDEGVLYHTGDLFHHSIEVAYPQFACHWANAAVHMPTRAALVQQARAEGAVLAASHIYGFGKLAQDGDRLRWETVEL